jgi:ribosome-binding factor A
MLPSRLKRVEELLQQDLARILQYEIRDPRVKFVTVTGVKVVKDLSEATAFVSILEDDAQKADDVMEGLESARGYIKRLLAERVVLKRLPDVRFEWDTSATQARRIYEILRKIELEQPEEGRPHPASSSSEEATHEDVPGDETS